MAASEAGGHFHELELRNPQSTAPKRPSRVIGIISGAISFRMDAHLRTIERKAKARTPNALKFEDRKTALDYMWASQIEGFRFSGAHLIDPEQNR